MFSVFQNYIELLNTMCVRACVRAQKGGFKIKSVVHIDNAVLRQKMLPVFAFIS